MFLSLLQGESTGVESKQLNLGTSGCLGCKTVTIKSWKSWLGSHTVSQSAEFTLNICTGESSTVSRHIEDMFNFLLERVEILNWVALIKGEHISRLRVEVWTTRPRLDFSFNLFILALLRLVFVMVTRWLHRPRNHILKLGTHPKVSGSAWRMLHYVRHVSALESSGQWLTHGV